MSAEILTVDIKGLSKLTSRNGMNWLATELVQNAWDQEVTKVDMTIESIGPGRGRVTITDDDPVGFLDLSHAYTLFAESNKRGNASLRGRFNLGEKLVIAYCVETGGSVEILTTSGGYSFSKKDGRKRLRRKTEAGSKVTAEFRASKETLATMVAYVHTFVPPVDFPTTLNGEELVSTPPLAEFEDFMPTVGLNEEGNLFRTTRKTRVEVIATSNGEPPMIYELGIPVVENPTKYHINVQQKVPLNMERNAVTPGYSRKVCALVLNATRDLLTEDEASQPWVAEAMESEDIDADTVAKVLDEKHGKFRVAHDPNNPEASAAAAAAGATVIYGGNHSSAAWGNIRKHKPVSSATTRFNDAGISFGGGGAGKDVTIPHAKWTRAMATLADYASELHEVAHGTEVSVTWVNDPRSYGACYGTSEGTSDGLSDVVAGLMFGGGLTFNKRRLGSAWINAAVTTERGFLRFLDLCIHEFAHKHSSSHYSDDFYKGCTRIGAAVAIHLSETGLPDWLTE